MSVWCVVSGVVQKPYRFISIRRLICNSFEWDATSPDIFEEERNTMFNFSFVGDGVEAAKQVEKFVQYFRDNNIRADIVAEIRFLT
jgi:hypothetical protein